MWGASGGVEGSGGGPVTPRNAVDVAVYAVVWIVGGAWFLYGALWLVCKAIDGIVFFTGTIFPSVPAAFRAAFAQSVLDRQKRKRANK